MIQYQDLIDKFRHALDERWGYILNTAGIIWTQDKQDDAERQYENAVARNDQKAMDRWGMAAQYGSKWIGRKVSDCSGLFVWAYKQLHVSGLPHGSNSIWKSHLSAKGELKKGKRTDHQQLKPGTAVFKLRNGNDYYHIGLYVGNNTVIEAMGTRYGVTTSKPSDWTHWGELKKVTYGEMVTVNESYERAVVTASSLNLREKPSKSAALITVLKNGAVLQAHKRDDGWSEVDYNDTHGFVMTQYITYTSAPVNTPVAEKLNQMQALLDELKALLS